VNSTSKPGKPSSPCARLSLFATLAAAFALTSCSTGPDLASAKPKRSKEYFAESEYGVKASPRVSNLRTRLPRGGGRDQIGRPYQIKGKWYHPKEVPNYRNSGMASWYGDAFHGRLTANGEIYDMTHLTAAHPTMPLPSYARVTNKSNGASVIVRVNDRGPYAHGRVVDLSRRAAEMLDYTHNGIARVDVEYLGRAPLHGQDDAFLMASYRPGNRAPDPSDGLPTGVMIAMNGSTPTAPTSAAPVFPGQMRATAPAAVAPGDLVLPDFGPIAPERPGVGLAGRAAPHVPTLAYTNEAAGPARQALDALASGAGSATVASPPSVEGAYVAVGTFLDRDAAEAIARALEHAGNSVIETEAGGGAYSVVLRPDGRMPVDDMLRTAWAAGASDALTVRE